LLARNRTSGYGAMCIYKKSSEQISQINIICAMHENTTYKCVVFITRVIAYHGNVFCNSLNIDMMVKK
jgi:hypothetical protein